MAKAYLLYGNDRMLTTPAGLDMGLLFGVKKIEKVWLENTKKLAPDAEFERIWLNELLQKTAEKPVYIFVYPQAKPWMKQVMAAFPDVPVLAIDEL